MIQVKSKAEAIAWARKAPCPDGETIELRQVFEMSDFGTEVEKQEQGRVDEIAKQIDAHKKA